VTVGPFGIAFDVKRRSPTLFPVLPKSKVVLTIKRWQIGPYIVLKSNGSLVLGVRLCGFCHISISGFRVRASRGLLSLFCNLLRQVSRLSTVTVVFDVKRRSLTLFPALPEPEVVFNGKTVADMTIYCIKVE